MSVATVMLSVATIGAVEMPRRPTIGQFVAWRTPCRWSTTIIGQWQPERNWLFHVNIFRKSKEMKRGHEELRITRREWRRHHSRHVAQNRRRSQGFGPGQRRPGLDSDQVDCSCDEQAGRFRKKHAHDCGLAHCQVCHGYKFPWREKSRKERLADLTCKEERRMFIS